MEREGGMTESRNGTNPQLRTGPRRVKSLDHAVDVLQVMGEFGRPVGVSEVARRTGLGKATVHHILVTLEERRMVMREPETPLYRLGWALYELGSHVVRDVDLSRAARPHLDQLARHTGESVLLGILDGDSVLYLDRGEAPAGLQMRANAGRRGPLHATASGKVLLATTPDKALVDRVLNAPLPKLTSTTITHADALRRQLDAARREGYATCWEEREVGLSSVAVALRDYTGAVAGSLAIAGPAGRLTKSNIQAHLGPLMAAGHQIEARLGGTRFSAAADPQPGLG
jgi:DNA-binding IclR family transcriptional regulator